MLTKQIRQNTVHVASKLARRYAEPQKTPHPAGVFHRRLLSIARQTSSPIMPPKKLKKTQCYDWVPSIPDASLITARHRRAAAGLTGQLQCSFPYSSLPTPGPSTLSDNGSDVVITKDTGCTAGKCKKNPRCYNQIGVAEVIRAKKEEWIEDQLGDGPAIRVEDQPAGLRNLGATCYVSSYSFHVSAWLTNRPMRSCRSGTATSCFAMGFTRQHRPR